MAALHLRLPHTLSSPRATTRTRRYASRRKPPLPPQLANPALCSLEVERGVEFETGASFFRRESAHGRDLGVLSAALHARSTGRPPRILDAMCGCGVRSLRYLRQAGAGFVWANDANEEYRRVIVSNLARAGEVEEGAGRRWVVSHLDANRVLVENYLHREFFDMVDIDSFGSDSSFLRSAIEAVKIGGLLYVTSTDGYSSGGHRPHHSLASYGAYIRPMPFSNELLQKMWQFSSIYLGRTWANVLSLQQWTGIEVSHSLVVSGPLWTGPLHNTDFVREMLELAKELEWAYPEKGGIDLEKLLTRMLEESDPNLPFGYIKLDEVASRAKINSPPVSAMITTLQKEGYSVSRSHIAANAIKTNCPMATCIQIAKELQQNQPN